MAKYYVLTLTADEQTSLTEVVQQRRVASTRLVRAQCLLAMATNGLNWTDAQTAQAYSVSIRPLERLRQRAWTPPCWVSRASSGQPAHTRARSKPTWRPPPALPHPPATLTGPCRVEAQVGLRVAL